MSRANHLDISRAGDFRSADRGPRLAEDTSPLPYVLSTVVDVPTMRATVDRDAASLVRVGGLVVRDGLDCKFDTQLLLGEVTFANAPDLSLEMALFPFLFPHGIGALDGKTTLTKYLKFRMRQAFSVFTLYKPYLLLMYQIHVAVLLATHTSSFGLSRGMAEFKRNHPEADEEGVMANAVKYDVPHAIEGSPAYHRRELQDLLCRVDAWGVPDLFMTLTADETSEFRFEEMDALDAFMERFDRSLTWRDAPVECARLFLSRYGGFLARWIDGPKSAQMLGRVLHHVTRLEVQHRGSLHVHVLLWTHPEDIARVANEIIAYVPAAQDPRTGKFIPPDPAVNPLEHRLFNIVVRKQMHRCTDWKGRAAGCRDDKGRCKMLFPMA